MPRTNPMRCWVIAAVITAACAIAARPGEVPGNLGFTAATFGVQAGLPSNVVQAVVQTRDGYLWVGTEAGLARFDGVRFRIFRAHEVPQLGDNLIRCLLEDRDGVLWIGTQDGLARYVGGEFERIGGLHCPVGAITQDRAGSIWIGTQGAGLWQYREGRLRQRADGILMKPGDSPLRVFADSSDRIWAAVNRGPLLCLQGETMRLPEGALARFRQTNCIIEAPRGTLWFATQDGLFRLRDGEVRQYGKSVGVADEQITNLYYDSTGRLWVAAHTLWVVRNPEADEFTRVTLSQVEYPRHLVQDREGTFWIGSSGDGLARMRPSAFRIVRQADNTPLPRARAVTTDRSGYVWAAFGGEARGLVRIAPDGQIGFLPRSRGADADVFSVCATRDGAVWVGSRGALDVWRDGRVERLPAYRNVRVLFEARDGTVWLGFMAGGMVCYRAGKFEPVQVPSEVAQEMPSAFADDPNGGVYVGYWSHGILRIADGVAQRIAATNKLPSGEIRAIHVDAEGRLWVGLRRHGLAVLLDGRWWNPDELVQPFGERVTAINEDARGNLWLGTMRGVMWGRKDDFVAVARGAPVAGRFRIAAIDEGVGGGVIGAGAQPATCTAADGTLWFAGREGLVVARPGDMPKNPVPPPVHIESVVVDGRKTVPGRELQLPAGVRSLTIDYTALSFVQPSRVTFRHRLAGHDEDWVQAGTRRTAFYTRLEPGQYEFQVIAGNEDGVWNETGASLMIVQSPWFYQTWWFVGLAVLGVVSMGLGLYYWRTAGLRRQVARQTTQIRAQLEEKAQLQAELERKARLESLGVLAGGIAHDFNNLLTVIMANIGLAASDERTRVVAGDFLAAAERGARRAADLTQQLLTFAKGGDPVCRAVALPDVVREAADFARHGTQVRCDITIEPDLPPASADRAQISRVIHNLVLNATQAMPQGGVIRIRLGASVIGPGESPALGPGRYVQLSICDEGIGIAPENLPRVFDPYFSTKPRNHGLGLATVHSIVKKHRGHVTVESQVGRGSTFHVWLPAANDVPEATPATVLAAARAPRRRLRVLFMDDEEIIRTTVANLMREFGHAVTIVVDGADAIREYEAGRRSGQPYDVVVLDLTVPGGMGGLATMDVLRRMDPRVKVIVSSGYSSDPVLAHFREYGFAAVVPKPYRPEVLGLALEDVAANEAPGANRDPSSAG